ncbi:GntR family transcriptional regulator [Brevibacterium atlanticum]|uniref:GntR family transcriptional regulator n=1 Tax=Brevibacterium atlanticum TaxID=2697563 RepID=UPI001D186AF4|nr:GntR family transcriptional regulator [Brevibacterium atlanticum]
MASKISAWAAREVIECRIDSGSLLTESDLARALGASRTPAREAMLELERWGLVRLVPKKGAIVTSVTMKDRHDLLAVRTMFETGAVQSALASSELERLAVDLRYLLGEQRQAYEAGDLLRFAAVDFSFHARIIGSGNNEVVNELLATMGPRLARLTYRAVLDHPEILPSLLAEHERLIERAECRDALGFGRLVKDHIWDSHSAIPVKS